ncbi:MAG TPA: PAS domain S-box protein, partial [Coleofasciculaceae cyanobacterium]
FDRDMRYIVASQVWVDEYNLGSLESLINQSHYELFPEIPERWRQIHQRCLAGAIEKCDEDLFVRADGTEQWISWEIHPWHTATHEIGGIIIFAIDITKRKQTEVALRQSEERYRTLFESIDEGFCVIEMLFDEHNRPFDYRFLEINPAFEKQTGLPQAVGKTASQLIPNLEQHWFEIYGKVALTGEPLRFEHGSEAMNRWFDVYALRVGQPSSRKVAVVFKDITARKQAEIALVQLNCELEQRVADRTAELTEVNDRLLEALIALQESEERRRLALDLTHLGFWDLHLLSGKNIWNDNLFTLLGLAPYDIESSYELWRSHVHPDDMGWVEQRFLESMENHTDYTAEYRVVHPDGSVHWLMGRGKAIYDESGQAVRSLGVVLDISDRKRAEETLQQYERIISNTKDGIALMNRHYIYQVANQGYLSWCNKSAHEVIGNSVRNILGQDLFDNFIQPRLEQCLAGETIQYERWFDYPNLVPQFLSVTYTPYRDASENISGVIVSLRDLTQLKQAEQMLELQAVITRNMAEGICLVRADNGVIVYANPKFEQMFGYDSGELNGQHVSIVNYASDGVTAEDVNQSIRSAVLQSGAFTYEVHNVKKDGTPFWCSATCSVFRHPDYGDVLVAVQQDITVAKRLEEVRKRTEEELRQSEAKFRSLSESSPLGIFMTDIGGQCTYINPRYQVICGCTLDEALGDGWVQFIHPEEREEFVAKWSNAVSQRQEFRSEIRYVRQDGTIRFGRVRSAPIFSVADEVIGYVGTVEDVTDSRAVETMKQEFISIVSHELRTPLTSIRGSLGLVAAGVFKNKPEAAQQMLDIAAHDTERLVRLVNDILDLERLESHKVNLVKQWCDAATLLEQSVETVQSLAAEGKITLCVASSSIQIWVDCDRIIQTLVNLVSNAIKFSPPETTVTLRVEDQADRVLFQVKDQGRGIPADKLDTIFGRFQQVDASDSRQKGGTGLGLAICKSIVQQHGGKIWVESVVGEGSSFYFTVPKSLD